MFRTVFPSIIRSLRLYIQHQVYTYRFCWLLASGNEMELSFHLVPASKQSAKSVCYIPDAVCTVLDSWWWTERPSETCRVLLQSKINLKKLVHLIGFTTEIYHDARLYTRQTLCPLNTITVSCRKSFHETNNFHVKYIHIASVHCYMFRRSIAIFTEAHQ